MVEIDTSAIINFQRKKSAIVLFRFSELDLALLRCTLLDIIR